MTAEETVRCDFQAGGISQAKEAFRTMEQSLARLEKLALKYHDTDERGTLRAAKVQRESANATVKSAATFADARAEIAKREAKKRLDGEKAMFAGLEKLEREHTRTVAAEAQKRERAAAHAADAVAKRRGQMGSAITGGVGRGIARPIGAIAQYGSMAMSAAGGFALADAAKSYMSTESASINLANSMFNPNDEDQKKWLKANKLERFDKGALMSFAGEASAASGVDKTAFLTGAQDYIAKSSDWQAMTTAAGKKTMIGLGQMATATGTDFGQLMSAAGSLRVQNPNLEPEKMMEVMRAIVGQGKMGAVEMKDLATHASVITSGAGKFVGKGGYSNQAEAQQALLGLSQIAIRTSGSSAEAATAVKAFGSDIGAKGSKAEHGFAGLHVKDAKTGSLLKASDIVENIFNATGGDVTKMGEGKGHVGLGRESIRIMEALKTQFDIGKQEALAKNPKLSEKDANKAGALAAKREVQKFEQAGYNQKDIDRDFKLVTEGAGKRIDMASQRIRNALEVKMAPVVERLADKFVENEKGLLHLVDALGKLAEFLLGNPLEGLGLIVAAAITKEIATAAIGEGIATAMAVPAIKAAATQLAGSLGVLGAAVLATAEGMKLIDHLMAEKARADSKAATAGVRIEQVKADYLAKVRAGTATPEDLEKAKGALQTAKEAQSEEVRRQGADAANPLRMAADLVDPEAAKSKQEADAANYARTQKALEELAAALGVTTVAVRAHGDAASALPNPNRAVPMSSFERGGL